MLYSSRHIASLFSVSRETVRTWANEFSRHLSVAATPGQGRHRNFTEDDLTVFSLVKQMKDRGLIFDEIHMALDNGERGESPVTEAKEIVAGEGRQQLILLQREISRLEAERDALAAELRPTQDENIRLKALLERSDAQLAEARKEVRALYEEIGLLKARRHIDGD